MPPTSGRHQQCFLCTERGKSTAEFSNGSFQYGAFQRLIRPDGSPITDSAGVVAVLPDHRLLVVVEERWSLACYPEDVVSQIWVDGKLRDMADIAPGFKFPSVEFPGGAIDFFDASYASGALREVFEEAGVTAGELFLQKHGTMTLGSDMALRARHGVLLLESSEFRPYTTNDGGLHVLALTSNDVERNIIEGRMNSGQAAQSHFFWYKVYMSYVDTERLEQTFSRQKVSIKTLERRSIS